MIIRRKHKSRFAIIPNSVWDDPLLSIEAKGTLGYLLSRPPDWTVRHDQLQRHLRIGRKWLVRIVEELIRAGYLKRDDAQQRDERNRFLTYNYIVTDAPDRVHRQQISGAPIAHRRRPLRDRDTGNKKEKKKKDSTNLPPYPPHENGNGSRPAGSERRRLAERSAWHRELAALLYPGDIARGYATIGELGEGELEHLRCRQVAGTLDAATLQRLRGEVGHAAR